jgi:hypothetical protein
MEIVKQSYLQFQKEKKFVILKIIDDNPVLEGIFITFCNSKKVPIIYFQFQCILRKRKRVLLQVSIFTI